MEETNNTVVSMEHVTFRYGATPVLTDVSLAIHTGNFVGIIGKNGSGKSTLLKLILGQLTPQEGTVFLNSTASIGYVEQITLNSDSSFPASVMELVTLGLYEKIGKFHFANKHHKVMVKNALKMVGLHGFENKQFAFLSGGQQQRVIIAKALVSNPDVLVLDEPTTGIDANSEQEFFSLLHHLNKGHGKTIVMVTHNFDKLKNTSNVFLIEDGIVKETSHV